MAVAHGGQHLGRWLKKLREDKGQTQEQLAQKCRVTESTISLLERGLRKPGAKLSARLGRALGVNGQEVFLAARATEDRVFALGHQRAHSEDRKEETYDPQIEGLLAQLYRLRDTLSPYDYKMLHAVLASITEVYVQGGHTP